MPNSNGLNCYGRTRMPSSEDFFNRLLSADCVGFDVDSTVLLGEGIDELALHCGVSEEVKRITSSAMDGSMTFQESLRRRLELIKPSLQQIDELMSKNVLKLSPNVEELINLLHNRGVHVYLISGGFSHMIHPIAKLLGIPVDRVYANELRFCDKGQYVDFNTQAFTSCSGGKGRVMQHIRSLNGYRYMVMVGDGATDLEARCHGGADVFIGYGGNVERQKVKENADWFITDFQDYIHVINGAEPEN